MAEKIVDTGKIEPLSDNELAEVMGGVGTAWFTAPDGTKISLGDFKSEAEASKKALELMAQYQGGSYSFAEDL